MKNLIILGSCGSIGRQTLDVIEKNMDKFNVVGISVGRNLELASDIISKYKPKIVCARIENDAKQLSKEFINTSFVYGDDGLISLVKYNPNCDIEIVNALVGSVGLLPTIEAIKIKRNVLLANKETLVVAGDIVMEMAKKYEVTIFPIDSEHSAIYQCLVGENNKRIKKLIITASGGAFRDKKIEELYLMKKEDALKHPNWSMGEKITIDCATMMNKGFEVIEAHHLYSVPYEKIKVYIHKESIVHSLVEFSDSSIKAQLANPDMRLPISYALSYPDRVDYDNPLDLTIKDLSFEEVDYLKYPCFTLALEAGKKGNIFPCVLNAANEASVSLFLKDKIKFTDIYKIVEKKLNETSKIDNLTIEAIMYYDKKIKEEILKEYGEKI